MQQYSFGYDDEYTVFSSVTTRIMKYWVGFWLSSDPLNKSAHVNA
jgi:hypothetical protein